MADIRVRLFIRAVPRQVYRCLRRWTGFIEEVSERQVGTQQATQNHPQKSPGKLGRIELMVKRKPCQPRASLSHRAF
jgi:hypothetical protein